MLGMQDFDPLRLMRVRDTTGLYRSMNKFFLHILFFLCVFLVIPVNAQETLSFEQVLELTQKSPSVQLAQQKLELTKRQLDIASGLISAELGAGYTQRWSNVEDAEGSSFDAITLQATFNVVPFGPKSDAIQRAKWNIKRVEQEFKDAHTNTVVGSVTEYLTTLRAAQEIILEEANIAVAQTSLDAAKARFEVGAANDIEVLQAEIALNEVQNDLVAVRQKHLQALATLSQTLGIEVVKVVGEPPPAHLLELEDPVALLAKRSDVTDAKLTVLESKLSRDSTIRDFLPKGSVNLAYSSISDNNQVQLGAGFDMNDYQPSVNISYDPDISTASTEVNSQLSLSVGVNIPLDTATPAALVAAELTIEQSRVQAEQTLELAVLELTNRQNEIRLASSNIELTQQGVARAEKALGNAKKRYELGVIPIIDLKQAEADFLEAMLNNDRAQDDLLLATLKLAQTLSINPLEVFE